MATNVIRPRKASLWLVLLIPVLYPLMGFCFAAGMLWIWIYGSFVRGSYFGAKMSGYETQEEMIKRMVEESK